MLMRKVSSKDKIPTGLLRNAVAAGAAVAFATASLGVVGTATASCINFSGIAIGGGGSAGACQAAFGSIAIVIGPTPVNEDGEFTGGSTASAGNPSVFSLGNIAISVGGTVEQPTSTSAGQLTSTGLPNIGNVSFATAGSSATTAGLFNLGASLGGTRSTVIAAGAGNSALNIGSDNVLASTGVVNNATNLFGNENEVASSNTPGTGLARLLPGLNVAFNTFGDNNTVLSGASVPPVFGGPGSGPFSIAGAIGVNDQTGLDTVRNTNFGIELRTPFNVDTGMALNNLSVSGGGEESGTQGGVVKQLLSFRPGGNAGPKAASLGGSGATFKAVSDQINTSVKKLSEAVNKVTNSLAPKVSHQSSKE